MSNCGSKISEFYLPMQKVEKMRFRMSSAVVTPVIASMRLQRAVEIEQQQFVRHVRQ